jgi:inosine/xanthosine triphosphatase
MKIHVGTKNQRKVEAVIEALKEYSEFADAEVLGIDVSSEISDQPVSLEETVNGAINRSKNAFVDSCNYAIGLESGLFEVPHTKSGYMDVCICSIYDGKEFYLGGSSLFEYPKKIVDLVFSKHYEIDQAAKEAGFTESSAIGKAQGMIGLLTRGVVDRKEYSKQAVITALIQLLNPEHY